MTDLQPASETTGLRRTLRFRDLVWAPGVTYGDVYLASEQQFSTYNFAVADVDTLLRHFADHEAAVGSCLAAGLPLPAYDHVLKCSHAFNLLDARGAISVTERVAYIARVRTLARHVAEAYVAMTVPS